jgi:hypothetical protein
MIDRMAMQRAAMKQFAKIEVCDESGANVLAVRIFSDGTWRMFGDTAKHETKLLDVRSALTRILNLSE